MVPLNIMVVVLWGIFGLVGIARRFPKELGATIGFIAMMLLLSLLGNRVGNVAYRAASAGGADVSESLVKWFVYTGIITLWVMFMYAGETLVFPGAWPPGRLTGLIIDGIIGLLNGWLVVGTWLYFTAQLGYPIQQLGWVVPPINAQTQKLVSLTPLAVIPAGQATIILGLILVVLIALRVFR
jgi:uncharacterized membrane protein required for colicin V production